MTGEIIEEDKGEDGVYGYQVVIAPKQEVVLPLETDHYIVQPDGLALYAVINKNEEEIYYKIYGNWFFEN